MKFASRGVIFVAGCVALLIILVTWKHNAEKNEQRNSFRELHTNDPAPDPTNDLARLGRRLQGPQPQQRKSGFEALSEAERNDLTGKFDNAFRPALERWCNVYAGHVPFRPDALSVENFRERIGRGDYYGCYVFILNRITIGIEERNGVAQVSYINTPQTQKLMDLPHGEAPDISTPVTREEVTRLIQEDSGKDFMPSDIRIVPTALASAMQGGINVMVGGDSLNSASWKYTLTFGPDKMLTYYLKGNL